MLDSCEKALIAIYAFTVIVFRNFLGILASQAFSVHSTPMGSGVVSQHQEQSRGGIGDG